MGEFPSRRVTLACENGLSFASGDNGSEVQRAEDGNRFILGALTMLDYRFL